MHAECFVTGGSGFIGQHLLARLTRQGHPVSVLLRQPQTLPQLQHTVEQLGGNDMAIVLVDRAGKNGSTEKLGQCQLINTVFLTEDKCFGHGLDGRRDHEISRQLDHVGGADLAAEIEVMLA